MASLLRKSIFFLFAGSFLPVLPSSAQTVKGQDRVAPVERPVVRPPATSTPIRSDARTGISFGVGWPYVGVRDFFDQDFGAEFRFAAEDGVHLFLGRGYWRFTRSGVFSLLTGAEIGYFGFNTMNADNTFRVSGNGWQAGPFLGLDYQFDQRFSFLFDVTMPIIVPSWQEVTLSDVQWVINGGVYFYPF